MASSTWFVPCHVTLPPLILMVPAPVQYLPILEDFFFSFIPVPVAGKLGAEFSENKPI